MSIVFLVGRLEFYFGFNKFFPFYMCMGREHGDGIWRLGVTLEKY